MHNHVFLHLSDRMISEFCAKWIELKNYLNEFASFEHKQQQQKDKNEFHEMIMKEAQQSMKDIFKQLHQHHCLDDDSNIDESHQVESMEDIRVSACFNLFDLHQPPSKKTKTYP